MVALFVNIGEQQNENHWHKAIATELLQRFGRYI